MWGRKPFFIAKFFDEENSTKTVKINKEKNNFVIKITKEFRSKKYLWTIWLEGGNGNLSLIAYSTKVFEDSMLAEFDAYYTLEEITYNMYKK